MADDMLDGEKKVIALKARLLKLTSRKEELEE